MKDSGNVGINNEGTSVTNIVMGSISRSVIWSQVYHFLIQVEIIVTMFLILNPDDGTIHYLGEGNIPMGGGEYDFYSWPPSPLTENYQA